MLSSARRRYDLPGAACLVSSADRCSALGCVPCLAWSALVLARPALLPVMCRLSGYAGRCREPPAGYMGRAGSGAVDTSRRKNSKKGVSPSYPPPLFCAKHPIPYCQSQKFPTKTKRPLQRVCVMCYTCLTSLEREESAMNQKNDKNKERREKNEKIAASIWGIIIGAALLVFGVYLMAHGISNVI